MSSLGRFSFLGRRAFRSLANLLVFSLFILLSPWSGLISFVDGFDHLRSELSRTRATKLLVGSDDTAVGRNVSKH